MDETRDLRASVERSGNALRKQMSCQQDPSTVYFTDEWGPPRSQLVDRQDVVRENYRFIGHREPMKA